MKLSLINEAGAPTIGIFWFINGKDILDFHEDPREASVRQNFRETKYLHNETWRNDWGYGKYTDHPRGRVSYIEDIGKYIIIAATDVVWNPSRISKVRSAFNLPRDTGAEIDSYYDIVDADDVDIYGEPQYGKPLQKFVD